MENSDSKAASWRLVLLYLVLADKFYHTKHTHRDQNKSEVACNLSTKLTDIARNVSHGQLTFGRWNVFGEGGEKEGLCSTMSIGLKRQDEWTELCEVSYHINFKFNAFLWRLPKALKPLRFGCCCMTARALRASSASAAAPSSMMRSSSRLE